LPQRKGDAAKIVPALMGSLKDKQGDVRRSAAIGLGYFGEQARDAIPALQAAQRDRDARVREAAGVALSRIDPARFPTPSKVRPARRK
jgi:HEAT repeat protein